MDRPTTWERLSSVSGALFAAVQIAATAYFLIVLAPHLPPLDAPLEQQGQFYSQYTFENALVAYLSVLPMPFFLVFLGGVFALLRRIEGGVGALTATALAAGVSVAIIWPIGIVVADSGQGLSHQGLAPLAVMAFDGVAQLSLALSALAGAVLLVTIAAGVLSADGLPRWLAYSAVVLAVVNLIGSVTLLNASLYPILAIGTLLFDIWVAALSGMLLRRVTASRPGRLAERASLAA
ncbi:MAG: hypothetical protein JOY61_05205 [Chloroflexi bacterium]|nr:hypothetical protein [Chloroflexota bacterium]